MTATLTTTLERTALPGPGIYPGVPAAEYHAWPYASNSALTKLQRSPAHLRASIENPRAPTPAMLLGTAIHAALLEPEVFRTTYAIAHVCSGVTGKGEACKNSGILRSGGVWFCGVHGKGKKPEPLEVLTLADHATCLGVQRAAYRHGTIGPLLNLPGDVELSVVWDDPETGVRCKARIDKLCALHGAVLDLKSTEDASPREFSRTILNMGYHRQAAHYFSGPAANGVHLADWVFGALEKPEPHGVAAYRLADDAVKLGQQELRPLLRTWAECQERGVWPAYPDHVQDIHLPAWAYGQLEG